MNFGFAGILTLDKRSKMSDQDIWVVRTGSMISDARLVSVVHSLAAPVVPGAGRSKMSSGPLIGLPSPAPAPAPAPAPSRLPPPASGVGGGYLAAWSLHTAKAIASHIRAGASLRKGSMIS